MNKQGYASFDKAKLREVSRKGGLTQKGKPKSEEHKRKISEAMKKRYAEKRDK